VGKNGRIFAGNTNLKQNVSRVGKRLGTVPDEIDVIGNNKSALKILVLPELFESK
jgi:hypothetical protein